MIEKKDVLGIIEKLYSEELEEAPNTEYAVAHRHGELNMAVKIKNAVIRQKEVK